MSVAGFVCVTCDRVFPKPGVMAAHIQQEHPSNTSGNGHAKPPYRLLDLPDEDDDDDDDEAEDDLLPSSPPAAAKRIASLRRTAAVALAERNVPALETLLTEVAQLENHWDICADSMRRHSVDAGKVRRLVEWVLHDDCGLAP